MINKVTFIGLRGWSPHSPPLDLPLIATSVLWIAM